MSHSTLAAGLRQLRNKLASQQSNEDSDEKLLHAFAAQREDSAFAVLVRRHGPMVLHVCRRVLDNEQDAEDAFQATFLVLAQSAASLRKKSSLASFLHGTAYRLALSAKRAAARRRKHENRVPARAPVDPAEELSWREVRALLDEEIAGLPEKNRSVFVLCILENLSRAEAAQRLGLTERTVLSRLSKARKRLAQRLARYGVELTTVLSAIALATQPASALSPMLMAATIREALATASGNGLTGVVPAAVVELVQGASRAVMISKAKFVAALLLSATLVAGAAWWLAAGVGRLVDPVPADPPQPSVSGQAPRQDASKEVTVSGRVVDPDGKPVERTKLLFLYYGTNIPKKVWAASTVEGRFAFTIPVKEVEKGGYGGSYWEKPWEHTYVLAAAEGYGFAVARVGERGAADLTLRLVKDDVPIRGRILDLQGRPVAGVQVRIDGSLYVPEKGDLTAWLTSLQDEKRDPNLVWWAYLTNLGSPAFDLFFPPVTTGADGRFCIKGIGRERVAALRIEGPAIATQTIHVMTRPHETIQFSRDKNRPKKQMMPFFGVGSDIVAAPTRPIVGMVRDKDTGKPLAGITIETNLIANDFKIGYLHTLTDKEGRYRLIGLPKGDGNEITARTNDSPTPFGNEAADPPPYLSMQKKVANPPGLEPVTVDFALKRGVWVKGRVTDQTTGKPLYAHVRYYCFRDNPNSQETDFVRSSNYGRLTHEDGVFRIPVLPGHGLLAVIANHDHYLRGIGAEKMETIQEGDRPESPSYLKTAYWICVPTNYHALAEISPKPGEESITCNVALVRGRTLKGTVLDPDGKPLADAQVSGLKSSYYWLNADAEFTVEGLQPDKPRVLQFVHEKRKLAGALVLRGDEKEPISLRLQPWGVLTGRVVSPRGEPLSGTRVYCWMQVKWNGEDLHTAPLSTWAGKDGRFCIEGLAPGWTYRNIHVSKGSYGLDFAGEGPKNPTLRAGETKDLGDLIVKPRE